MQGLQPITVPEEQLPAFVWSQGQKAEKKRGIYFAKRGYATVDINWLGRPMQKDIEVNTTGVKLTQLWAHAFIKKPYVNNGNMA